MIYHINIIIIKNKKVKNMKTELKSFWINDCLIQNVYKEISNFKDFGKFRYSFAVYYDGNDYYECSMVFNNLNELKKSLRKNLKGIKENILENKK